MVFVLQAEAQLQAAKRTPRLNDKAVGLIDSLKHEKKNIDLMCVVLKVISHSL